MDSLFTLMCSAETSRWCELFSGALFVFSFCCSGRQGELCLVIDSSLGWLGLGLYSVRCTDIISRIFEDLFVWLHVIVTRICVWERVSKKRRKNVRYLLHHPGYQQTYQTVPFSCHDEPNQSGRYFPQATSSLSVGAHCEHVCRFKKIGSNHDINFDST